MANVKIIREMLGLTQDALAEKLDMSQGNVSNYENGQTFPPDRADALIALALTKGVKITYNDIYGPPPKTKAVKPDRKAA